MSGIIDQAAHYALGYAMARSLRTTGLTRDEQIAEVMRFAERREQWQHRDGIFGAGSKRDLEFWKRGAKRGASK
jgi:hypothetical protein